MLGSIFEREVLALPRREKHFLFRGVFIAALTLTVFTAWLLLTGIQPITNLGDLSRFGALVFRLVAPLQLVILMFMAALVSTLAVAHEKDRKTLDLLLITSLSNWEIVAGKIGGGVLNGLNLLLSGAVVLVALPLFGGVSLAQVVEVLWISAATIFACAAWGATVAFWREKTFQAIAISLLGIVLYLGIIEGLTLGLSPATDDLSAERLSPLRAVIEVTRPVREATVDGGLLSGLKGIGGIPMVLLGVLFTATSIFMLRVWNPSREARPARLDEEKPGGESLADTEQAAWKGRDSRIVWNNPILWREVCTWAYGRKVLLMRVAYAALAAMIAAGLSQAMASGQAYEKSSVESELLSSTARLLVPLLVVSLIIINALAVNSITNERDGQALDLLLVTEITPQQFIFGKLLGVLYVAKEMVVVPFLIAIWLWYRSVLSGEDLLFLIAGLTIMDLFVAMLGIHCGMIYSQSRAAIGTSLGTVFFLFLGVVTCMLIMISFRGSFGRQLPPFIAVILGGGTALYVALGYRNPSPAITLAAFGLPFLTFYAITSFLLRDQELTVFGVLATAYGFTTLAMLIPALSEFDFEIGRSATPRGED